MPRADRIPVTTTGPAPAPAEAPVPAIAIPLGETIRQIRLSRRMTLEQLASSSGLTKQAVRRIETGAVANASVATLLRISEALGVRIGVLMFLAERALKKDASLVGHEVEDKLADFWYRATSELASVQKPR